MSWLLLVRAHLMTKLSQYKNQQDQNKGKLLKGTKNKTQQNQTATKTTDNKKSKPWQQSEGNKK